MRIEVITLFPELVAAVGAHGMPRVAIERGSLELGTCNPRDFTRDRHRTVDDRPYGGGPGMLMKSEPLVAAIRAARDRLADAPVIYLSPQGERLDHKAVAELAGEPELILVCGRYEGIDERVIDSCVDRELSIGDYVLSGGELGAMVVVDAVARLLPGVLGHADSAREDSFSEGLLDCPHYTRPEVFEGRRVPEVLLSGDHARIDRWRRQQALGRTWLRRPDLIDRDALDGADRDALDAFLAQESSSEHK
ncbi:MAG: tRNA (guanosine(37)-N1)-methyltransferase TrmD [Halothiobacillaceae bacterium]